MKCSITPLIFKLLKLNPKMKVEKMQTISIESFQLLNEYTNKSNDPLFRGSIVDLGGGGEGIIGQIMGRNVTAVDIREQELADAPEGPFKTVADARDLPFDSESFYCVTSFYFLMYLKPQDYQKVFEEAHRVLKSHGKFIIWDTTIPKTENPKKRLFVVPLKIQLSQRDVYTAYGAPWATRDLNAQQLIQIAKKVGFVLEHNHGADKTIQLIFKKV